MVGGGGGVAALVCATPICRTHCLLPFRSGESGAGKTESCKFIVGHLTELSHAKNLTEQKIIQVGGAYSHMTCI